MSMAIIFNTMKLDFDQEATETQRPLSIIHIRYQQRNGKKGLTLVEGLAKDLDLKKILKFMKKKLSTNGGLIGDPENLVVMVQGDKRENVRKFLVDFKVWQDPDPKIVVHGS